MNMYLALMRQKIAYRILVGIKPVGNLEVYGRIILG
jgi:hypothetical protein